ncbi:transporter [Verrucomicrobiaceae bacterium 5K15]|uniref:Transporter n=1 Tax=Oceaniferula flava TaxID=2800421 RepID=A0AAE2SDK6_9BACT|nr:transporter [Oceaniferula flavus]MBK1854376.1 transporter [Oceaniferula flavus]MBM1135682.1 transporter [Oceaniferula flavus]
MYKNILTTALGAAALTSGVLAGPDAVTLTPPATESGFDQVRRPITNPTLFDLAIPRTQVRPIYIHQSMPNSINSSLGKLALGGDFSVYALQFEYALNERFSIVAMKDGYIDFNPDNTLSNASGFADIAAGVKYAFILDPVKQLAVSGSLTVEFPTGDDDVWQGNGDGAVGLNVAAVKLSGSWQFAGAVGVHLPFDTDAESTTGFASAHVGYNVTDRLYALAEMNWYHVISDGNGENQFTDHVGGAVPSVVGFEGGDLVNFGASNPESNIVTAAIGLRYKLADNADLGIAYEIPLTDEEDGLMEDRITVDLVVTF